MKRSGIAGIGWTIASDLGGRGIYPYYWRSNWSESICHEHGVFVRYMLSALYSYPLSSLSQYPAPLEQ
jgi:hypothetical protein